MTDYEIHVYGVKLPWEGIGARDISDLRKKLIKSGYPLKNPDHTFIVWNKNRCVGGLSTKIKNGVVEYHWVNANEKAHPSVFIVNPKTGSVKKK